MGHLNGDLRRAVITAIVGLVFTALTAHGGYLIYRLHRMEERQDSFDAEQFRIGKIASGRGERIDKLEVCCGWCRDRIVDLQVEMAREHLRGSAAR